MTVVSRAASNNVALNSPSRNIANIAPNIYGQMSNLIDPNVDTVWGGTYTGQVANPYYDYYFSGQDIKVVIDGTEADPTYGNLPISSFAFSVQQKKMTFYGYNSYTYDAVARGNRIINGTFAIYSRSPDFLTQAIALAAKNRSINGPIYDNYSIPLTEDDRNLQQYWGNNLDQTLLKGQTNLFSTHPPFSFIVTYGIQDTSIGNNVTLAAQNLQNSYNYLGGDDLLALDINDRLVPANPAATSMRFVLNDCELLNMTTMFDTTGQPVSEVYAFMARDIRYPS